MTVTTEDYAYLSKDAYQDRSDIAGTKKTLSINGHDYYVLACVNEKSGYAAAAYQRIDTGEVIIAERGTESKTSDIVTDFKMVRDETSQQWHDAQQFAE